MPSCMGALHFVSFDHTTSQAKLRAQVILCKHFELSRTQHILNIRKCNVLVRAFYLSDAGARIHKHIGTHATLTHSRLWYRKCNQCLVLTSSPHLKQTITPWHTAFQLWQIVKTSERTHTLMRPRACARAHIHTHTHTHTHSHMPEIKTMSECTHLCNCLRSWEVSWHVCPSADFRMRLPWKADSATSSTMASNSQGSVLCSSLCHDLALAQYTLELIDTHHVHSSAGKPRTKLFATITQKIKAHRCCTNCAELTFLSYGIYACRFLRTNPLTHGTNMIATSTLREKPGSIWHKQSRLFK